MKIEKHTTVAFSGYRNSKLISSNPEQGALEQLKVLIFDTLSELISQGYDTFLCGMNQGFDLMCANSVLSQKIIHRHIKLIAVIPYSDHINLSDKTYAKVMELSDSRICLSDKFTGNYLYLERNDFMLSNSSLLLCYYDGQKGGTHYTYTKAMRRGLSITNLAKNKLPQQLSLLG